GRREYVTSARRAMYCLAGLLTVAMVMLESAYLRTDLSYKLVAQNSSTDTPTFYKLTAMWSSQEGSLLLWAIILSVHSSVVPFAFAIGTLITRRTGVDWIRSTRRFALVAWTLLGCGILLGALWSYSVLGWGGYWAWDAVENASLMPWLLGTAFIHSVMVQEKRGMVKLWNAALILATFTSALIGHCLVRAGV